MEPAAVFSGRIDRALEALEERGLDGLVLGPSPNFLYFTGLSLWRSERLIAAVLRPGARPALLCPAFEASRVGAGPLDAEVEGWEEGEDPYALLAGILAGAARVALEEKTPFYEFDRLRRALPDAAFQTAEPVTQPLRRSKGPEEVAAIRAACRRTVARIGEIAGCLAPGMSEREAFEELAVGGMIQFGPTGAIPHASPGDNVLAEQDVVIVDTADQVEGYTSDITRTLFVAEPTDEMVKVYAIVKAAQDAAIAAARPGATGRAVDRAARQVIEDAGYGANFTHRTGHGLGLEIHEPPYLFEGNEEPLAPGDVVTVEPGIYLPGRWGVRIEDDVLITEAGSEVLSEQEEGMVVI